MNVLEFIFKFLWQFIQFEPGRFEELKEKAFAWRNRMDKEVLDADDTEMKWYHKVFKYDNEWYVQVGLAVFFLFAVKTFREWMMSDGSDDDDDDDDNEVTQKVQNVRQFIPNFKF